VVFRPSGSLLPLPNGYFDVLRPFRFFLPMPTARWFGLPLVATVAAVVVAFRVRGLPRFLLVASGVFLVLSAGPFLLWDGRPVQVAGHYVALPYRILDLVIPMTYGRTLTFPLRCVAVVTTGLGFLAGAFIVWLTTWLPRDCRLLGAAGFLALYLGECFLRFPDLFPVPSVPAQVPAFFRDLAHQEGGALLHLPLALPIERNWTHRQCLLSVLADRPMVNFHEAMEPSVAMTPGPMPPAADRDRFLETIARQGVEWIVVHRPQLTGARPGLNAADYGWLEECCGPPAVDAEGIRAYRVPGIGR
jgi:hypothetical protein